MTFALFHLIFMLLWVAAFNLAGGFTRASGSFVFWFGSLTIFVGTATKAFVGQAADSFLEAPVLLMSAYAVSMAVMLLSVAVARTVTERTVSVAGRLRSYNLDYQNASIGCTAVGIGIYLLLFVVPSGPGTVFSSIGHLNVFAPMAIILGTISTIRSTEGRRSLSWLNIVPGLFYMTIGFIGFSKQGMYTPAVCWVTGVAYTRYKLRFLPIVAFSLFLAFILAVLTPIAQVGKGVVEQGIPISESMQLAVGMLENLQDTRKLYNEASEYAIETNGSYFTGADVGILYRLTRIESDDPLFAFSAKNHYLGYAAFWYQFMNWFPHFILPDKEKYAPVAMYGNYYAREMGLLSSQDTTTGISIGSPAEAFHFDGWQALILTQLLAWVLLLTSVDLLCGDLRRSPWGLLMVLTFSHLAPEGGLLFAVAFIFYGNLGLFVAMIFSTYAAPVIGSALTSPTRRAGIAPPVLSRDANASAQI